MQSFVSQWPDFLDQLHDGLLCSAIVLELADAFMGLAIGFVVGAHGYAVTFLEGVQDGDDIFFLGTPFLGKSYRSGYG